MKDNVILIETKLGWILCQDFEPSTRKAFKAVKASRLVDGTFEIEKTSRVEDFLILCECIVHVNH